FGVVIGGLVLEEAGEVAVELVGLGVQVDLLVVGDDLGEFAQVVVDDLAGAGAVGGADAFLGEADGAQEVEVDALEEKRGVDPGGDSAAGGGEEGEGGRLLGGAAAKAVGEEGAQFLRGTGAAGVGGIIRQVMEGGAYGLYLGRVEQVVHADDD